APSLRSPVISPFGARSEPVTECPCCNKIRANPLIPQPPMPTKCTRRAFDPRNSMSCCLVCIRLHQISNFVRRVLHRQRTASPHHPEPCLVVGEQTENLVRE